MSTYIVLLNLDLTAAPTGVVHRLTTAGHNVIYDGHEYLAVGDLLGIDELQSTADLSTIGTSISLSGIDPAYRQEIDNGGFKRAPISLLIAVLPDNTNVVPNATYFHRGFCDTPNTEIDYDNGEMVINVGTQSILGNLDKIPDLCRTSQSSHASRHQGDDFFKFVASNSQEEIWQS